MLSRLCQSGGRRASQALATLLGESEVQVELFDAGFQDHAGVTLGLAEPDERLVGVLFSLDGIFKGHLSLLLTEPGAASLVRRLIGDKPLWTELGALNEEARAVLAEIGNIVASAFLNAFADALRSPWLPSPPEVLHARGAAIVEALSSRGLSDRAMSIALEAILSAEGGNLRGQLLFLPSEPVVDELLRLPKRG